MTRRAIALLLLSGAAFIALGYACLNRPHPMLVYNASTSVPKGWYRINAASPFKPGDWVLVRLPANASTLAMQRGYLPTTVPLLKPVAAVAPQRVCVEQQNVIVDGKVVAKQLRHDRLGRPLPAWHACRRLSEDELLLLSTSSAESFDSRYFGPVRINAVIGRALPLRQPTHQ